MAGLESWVEILPDFSQLDNKVKSHLTSTLGDAGSAGAGSFGSSFRSSVGTIFAGNFFANIAGGAARQIGEVIGTGIRAGIDYGLGSVSLASDLSETTSAVTQVYGDASADIISFAADANKSLGQTRVQALTAAQTFGVFAKQAGLTGKPLSNFSTGLVTLSADLASFFNASPDEAIEAIGAGLRGEAEPLRRFGVLLDDATLRSKALELGIYDGSDALTGQQRILAAQAVIFDQTSIAQGDFERTSGGLANQQRILAASLEDTQTKLGEALLPAFTSAAKFANETLVPALDGIIDKVGPILSTALTDAGPKFDELWAKAEPLIDGFLTAASEEGIPAFIGLMDEVVAAAPGWADAIDTAFDPDAQPAAFLNGLADGLNDAGIAVHNFFLDSFKPGTEDAEKFATTSEAAFNTFDYSQEQSALRLGDTWNGVLAGLDDAAVKAIPGLTGAGGQLGSGFAAGIRGSESEVTDAIDNLGDVAVGRMRLRMRIESPSRVFMELGSYVGQGFALGIDGERGNVASSVQSLVSIPSGPSSFGRSTGSNSPVAGVRDVHFHTEDPTVAYQMFKNEIGANLSVLPR